MAKRGCRLWPRHRNVGDHSLDPCSEIRMPVTILCFQSRLFCLMQNGSNTPNRASADSRLFIHDKPGNGLGSVLPLNSSLRFVDSEPFVLSQMPNSCHHVTGASLQLFVARDCDVISVASVCQAEANAEPVKPSIQSMSDLVRECRTGACSLRRCGALWRRTGPFHQTPLLCEDIPCTAARGLLRRQANSLSE